MVLVVGTNCGLVDSRPTSDPSGSSSNCNFQNLALKITPDTDITIKELGWWLDYVGSSVNWEIAIYSHNSTDNLPDSSIEKFQTNSTGTTAGWLYKDGLSIELTSGTSYWIVMQVDNGGLGIDLSSIAGSRVARDFLESTLKDPWDSNLPLDDIAYALYALIEGLPIISETDTTTLSDNLTIVKVSNTVLISESDTTNLSYNLINKSLLNRQFQDTSNITDSLGIVGIRTFRTFIESDTTTLSEDLTLSEVRKPRPIDETDSFELLDSLSLNEIRKARLINETDTTTLSEDLTLLEVRTSRLINESDTTNLSDSLSILSIRQSRLLGLQDSSTLSDNITINIVGGPIIKNLSDISNLSDSLTINRQVKTFTLTETDSTTISESISISADIIRTINESDITTLSDNLTSELLLNRTFLDNTNLSDSLNIYIYTEASSLEKYIFRLNDGVIKLKFD